MTACGAHKLPSEIAARTIDANRKHRQAQMTQLQYYPQTQIRQGADCDRTLRLDHLSPQTRTLFERGGRDQLSGLNDRRPIERLVNKGFVERHTLNSQQEEYVLTAIGKKVLDNK
jgi:hypothetical protein